MEYKINPGALMGIFPVPAAIVDDNIRLASASQLKVILYLLRHSTAGPIKSEEIASALMMDIEDVKDALICWKERGIIIGEKEEASAVPSPSVPRPVAKVEPEAEKKEAKPVSISETKPNFQQIAARLKESEELRHLCNEAQAILGKTIGNDGSSNLIMLHDTYGLPVEVIIEAVQYCVEKGTPGFSHILKIGRKWSELGIDSFESAEDYIKEHGKIQEVWDKLRSLTDFNNKKPTAKQEDFLLRWVNDFGYDTNIIYAAYEDCVDYTGKVGMKYMDKILTTWNEKGVKTLLDVAREKKLWKEMQAEKFAKKPSGKGKEQADHEKRQASYDINKFLKKATDLKYDKNDKN